MRYLEPIKIRETRKLPPVFRSQLEYFFAWDFEFRCSRHDPTAPDDLQHLHEPYSSQYKGNGLPGRHPFFYADYTAALSDLPEAGSI